MRAVSIACMRANARCASMTTRTWTCQCSRRCSTDDAADTKRSATRSCCRQALCPDARSPSADAEGTDRARSSSEAFLYRRLETLPETTGRFCLNVELPIPFDGWGRMEVELLSGEAGVVIELDGAQHLAE